jgi:hypothetical protein
MGEARIVALSLLYCHCVSFPPLLLSLMDLYEFLLSLSAGEK